MWDEGKQFADAPESSAALTDVVVLTGLKVTLLADLTWKTLPVFNIDLGDLVDMLDTDECDEFVVAIVSNDVLVSNDARFQLCIFGLLSGLKRPFLMSWKRAPISGFVFLSLYFGLEGYSMGVIGCVD